MRGNFSQIRKQQGGRQGGLLFIVLIQFMILSTIVKLVDINGQQIDGQFGKLSISVEIFPFCQNTQFEAISSAASVPVDQIRFVIGLVMILPLGWGFHFVKGPWLRHFVGTVLGIFLEYMVYRIGIISMLLQTVITYLMAKYIKNCGKYIMIETLVFMSAHHIYRQITDYGGWTLDITTILMMAVAKFTSFGYCIEDGRKKVEELSDDQKLRKIDKLPHFLEFFSYIHFFGSSIVGPAYDFYDYRLFINQENEMKKIPFMASVQESLFQMFQGFAFMAGSVLIANQYDLLFITTPEFGEHNFVYKFFWYNIVVTIHRFKYYGGWCLAQAGLASTGMTYKGIHQKTQKHDFTRVESCYPFKVELTHEIKSKVDNWNMSVQKWLQRYVYLRLYTREQLKNKALATKAQYITLMVSAFWHGFYAGYYTAFVQWGMMITINKMTYKWATNYPKNFKKIEKTISYPVYWALRFLFFNGMFNYFGCGFCTLSFEANWLFYKNMFFVPNVVCVLLTAFLIITNIGQRPPKTPEQVKKDQ